MLVISAYPLWMGLRVVSDMLLYGIVAAKEYPKYIIPYTPISLALLCDVLLMPLLQRRLPHVFLRMRGEGWFFRGMGVMVPAPVGWTI